MNCSHAHIPLVATSLLTLAIPVISAAVAAVLLDETLVAIQIAGMVVVIGALAVVAVHTARRRPVAALAEADAPIAVPEP